MTIENKKPGRITDYNKKLPVLEVYTCIQSEGSRQGRPTVAIRTTGCTHRCWFGEGGWCPDCEEAHPHIESAFAAVDKDGIDTVFAEVPLARASYSVSANPENASHWARVHPLFQLKKIPTLYRVNKTGNKKIGELVEGDAAKDDLLAELLE